MPKYREIAGGVWERMQRKKEVNIDDTTTSLQRCLTLKRLIFIGVGKTVGVGIYVLIGEATVEAGPSVIFSFLLGFLVTLLNGLCFSEYASKNPKTGAQYTYMYESVGEAMAFIVGWTSIIGYAAALSMGSRGWSGYVDSLFNHAIKNYTIAHIGNWTQGPPIPAYPDIAAVCVILFVMIITSIGVNFATALNTILAFVSASLLIFISVIGFIHADTDNWFKQPGGFFPGGMHGMVKASAACFYAFQGYEVLGYSAEETIDPKKDVPRSVILSLIIVTFLYMGVAFSFTLMIPYTSIDTSAPFPSAFQYNHVTWAKYVIEIGPILALTNLCVLEMYTIQRLTYSIAVDGLLFRFLAKVNTFTKVPIGPVLVFGPIVITLVLCIDLSNLIGFMVIYAFIQYSVFAGYLIILRYQPSSHAININDTNNHSDSKSICLKLSYRNQLINFVSAIMNKFSIKLLVIIIYSCCLVISLMIIFRGDHVVEGSGLDISALFLIGGILIIAMVTIYCREQKGDKRGFLVPLMPVLPVISIFFNLLMLVSVVGKGSLIASLVLAAIGAVIYLIIVVYDVVKNPVKFPNDTSKLLGDESGDENEL